MAEPPTGVWSAVSDLMVGLVPGVTVALRREFPPASTEAGLKVTLETEGPLTPPKEELRGSGAPTVKSAALSSVSIIPRGSPFRRAAVVADSTGTAAVPS